ncbi:GTPase domain-containing protein [Actinomadura soli]|uniref:GTPase domain-containing protein n=1 Tax=Actinomadura soli TaxID=2508997 RepID=A0A5C4JHA9_9ACTN|nr:GTPase domain-containing protein [Actinomadura soli]TMR04991.1 GTPase domain-containing protein [Actinomadura soli]
MRRFLIYFLLAIAILAVTAWSDPEPPTPTPTRSFPYRGVFQLSDDGKTLSVSEGTEVDYAVDVSGLEVNLACAKEFYLPDLRTIRTEILKNGCAKIVGSPLNSAERAAQDEAKRARRGIWGSTPSPSSTTRSQDDGGMDAGALFRWAKEHKLISVPGASLLLAILASPVLWKLGGWLVARLHRKRVRIIIAGVRGAGKTGLWTKLRREYESVSQLSPTRGKAEASIEPVLLRKWTILPTVVDTAGAEPWLVLQSMKRSRGIARMVERHRTKLVLLCVVAPCPEEELNGGDPFDREYITKQAGYMHLPMALIGQQDQKSRPDLVIMFVTKFDLLSGDEPDENEQASKAMATAFREHREVIETTCRGAGVRFLWIIGSAKNKKKWGIDRVRTSLAELMDRA